MLEKEIIFCKYFEESVLPNRNNVSTDMLLHCGNILGENYHLSCHSCIHNVAIDLKNLYYRLQPHYEKYKLEQELLKNKVVEPIVEQVIDKVVKPIVEKVVKQVVKPVKRVNKSIKRVNKSIKCK